MTNLSDLKIREEQLYTLFVNKTLDLASIFNAVSNGAIQLNFEKYSGFFAKTSQIEKPASLVSRQDITSNATKASKKFTETNTSKVKVFRKLGPLAITDNDLKEKEIFSEQNINFHSCWLVR